MDVLETLGHSLEGFDIRYSHNDKIGRASGVVGGGNQFPDNLLKARARIRGWRPARAGILDAVVDHLDLLALCVDTTAIFGYVTVPSDLPVDRIAFGDKEVLNH